MFLSLMLDVVLGVFESLVDDAVSAFAVKFQFPVSSQYHRHSFPDVVEVEDAQHLVYLLDAHYLDGDAVGRALFEYKAEVSGRRDEGRFVG